MKHFASWCSNKGMNTRKDQGTSENLPDENRISWHPAFVEAIKLELEDYQDSLEFYPEFQLTAEPLRIDCVVVKKKADIVIKKNIASIFREVNLLEYKNPDDYVSVNDFYKVYAYACLYASFEKVPVTNLTVSFIESHYPRELLTHLQKEHSFKVEENSLGIYTILMKMGNTAKSLDEVFIRTGLAAKWEARGKAQGMAIGEERGVAKGEERNAIKVARKMVNSGFPLDTVVSMTELDPEKVKALYQNK